MNDVVCALIVCFNCCLAESQIEKSGMVWICGKRLTILKEGFNSELKDFLIKIFYRQYLEKYLVRL